MALQTRELAAEWLDQEEYPFEPRYHHVDGGRMHYVDEGAGTPIVFVHGNPTWSFMYRGMIRDLSLKHRCVAMDHIGFGLSDKPAGWSYKPEDQARNFAALMNHLDLRDVTLVVHEFGGPIALEWAVENPSRVKALVVMNSWMWPIREEPAAKRLQASMGGPFAKLLNSAVAGMSKAFFDKFKLPDRVHAQYRAPFAKIGERDGIIGLAHGVTGSSPWLAGLWARHETLAEKRMLLLWGMQDPFFGEQMLARWQSAFPKAQVETLVECGHYLPEECAKEAEAALYLFLDGHEELSGVSAGLFGTD